MDKIREKRQYLPFLPFLCRILPMFACVMVENSLHGLIVIEKYFFAKYIDNWHYIVFAILIKVYLHYQIDIFK